MAVDVYTTTSTSEVSISPRISFSHDLKPDINDSNPITSDDHLLLSPTFDFNFRTSSILTPADELFSNGKILPTQIKKQQITHTHVSLPQKKRLKEFIQDQDQEKPTSSMRSFWQFGRSASMNCDNSKAPKGLLRSLSIKSLSRSYSTGSAALNPKRNSGQKVVEKSKDSMLFRRPYIAKCSLATYAVLRLLELVVFVCLIRVLLVFTRSLATILLQHFADLRLCCLHVIVNSWFFVMFSYCLFKSCASLRLSSVQGEDEDDDCVSRLVDDGDGIPVVVVEEYRMIDGGVFG
ncbi:hypothetical protein QVD17_31922 [Tagetes erecta]|uniref:Uncharacterized protein n=1 Tax=Tagetes erecta TaxID=13708 RepID=A0AAD8NP09_TARER|nr:hypothetical protein QVD17_31922 [Tagetes erecta]